MYTNNILNLLREALAAEFIAAHNYWTQAQVVQGFNKEELKKELIQHQQEEMEHANLLSARIQELGGDPEIKPIDWDKLSRCRFMPSINRDQIAIANDAIQGEYCAIEHYKSILTFIGGKDQTTYDLIQKIIQDEEEHIQDLAKIKDASSGRVEVKTLKTNTLSQL